MPLPVAFGLMMLLAGCAHTGPSPSAPSPPPDGVAVWESNDRKGGGDRESAAPTVEVSLSKGPEGSVRVFVPQEPVDYPLFVVFRDSAGHAGTANAPFRVHVERP